jgi:parallel beta-helix repeat protein
MILIAILVLLLGLSCCSTSVPESTATVIEVSPEGPYRSLDEARDRIRSLRRSGSSGPFTVQVRAGTYRLTEPFVLKPEDSGSENAPVVYRAYPGERVVISGGRVLDEEWSPGPGRISTKQIAGVKDGEWYFRQLFVNGRRAQRARTPNLGYYRIHGPSSQDKPFRLKYTGSDIQKEWAGSGAEAVILLGWTGLRQQIVRVDLREGVAILSGDAGGNHVGVPQDVDARYFIENAPDGLDYPGEWYLDRGTGLLSYWPLGGETLDRLELVAPTVSELVRLEGDPGRNQFVRHITFRDLHFEHADWVLPPEGHADYPQAAVRVGAAFQAEGAEDCAIENSSFRRLGGYAIWFAEGCKRNRIVGNHISDIGGGGIKIGETEMHEDPARQNFDHVIEDNHIHHLGQVYPEAVGIWIGQSSRSSIAHNTIHDLYYTGISVGWTWGYEPNQSDGHRIEYNHIYEVGKNTLNDLGAIYTLGQQPNTVIRNNLIHDITSYAERGRCIYLDEGSVGILVENNVVYRCKSSGFHLHYGRDNLIRNNIFALNHEVQFSRGRAESHRSFTFERNIVYFNHGRLIGAAWSDDQFLVRNNLYFDARGDDIRFHGASFEEWGDRTGDKESVIADPLFVNPERFQFDLRPGSPAFKMGFQPIDLTNVGVRSPHRSELPGNP